MIKNTIKIAAALFAFVMAGCGGADKGPDTPALVAPVLEAPAASATDVPTMTTFTWASSGDNALYTLSVSDDIGATWAELVTDVSARTYTVTADQELKPQTTYYWKVAAKANGETKVSSLSNFVTGNRLVFAAPVLHTPGVGARDVSTTPEFVWSATVPGATYTIMISVDDGGDTWTTVAEGLTDTNYTLTAEQELPLGISYLWKVAATYNGETKESPTSYFRTISIKDGEVIVLLDSEKASPFNIYITGDGFVQSDWDTGFFVEEAEKIMEYFFALEPYKTYKEYFRVSVIAAISNVSGVVSIARDTRFKTTSRTGMVEFPNDIELVYDFVSENVPGVSFYNSLVIMFANCDDYGGGCWWYGVKPLISSAMFQEDSGIVINHEAGHGIGNVADEYIQSDREITQAEIDRVLNARNGDIWKHFANVDFSGDRNQAVWAKYYDLPEYRDEVGYVEGGMECTRGVWRPTQRSLMMNDFALGYNVVCREATVRKILQVAGEPFVWEEFLAKDSNAAPVYPTH